MTYLLPHSAEERRSERRHHSRADPTWHHTVRDGEETDGRNQGGEGGASERRHQTQTTVTGEMQISQELFYPVTAEHDSRERRRSDNQWGKTAISMWRTVKAFWKPKAFKLLGSENLKSKQPQSNKNQNHRALSFFNSVPFYVHRLTELRTCDCRVNINS